MMRSLFSGVSGLKNHQTRMDVIGNNIANVNTVGFKSGQVQFQDVLSQTLQGSSAGGNGRGGTNPMQVGLGMGLASISTVFTDGSFQPTGKATDLSVQGQGFFVLSDDAAGLNKVYTRAGNFDFDAQGNFIVPGTGYLVQGWTADADGNITISGDTGPIKIPVGDSMKPKASQNMTFGNNLMATTPLGESVTESLKVYDSLGIAHQVQATFTRVGDKRWLYSMDVPDATGAIANRLGEITFKDNGIVDTISTVTPAAIPTAGITASAFQLNSTAGSIFTQPVTVFDASGNPHVYDIKFTNTGTTSPSNDWTYSITESGVKNATAVKSGVVKWDGIAANPYSFFASDGVTVDATGLGFTGPASTAISVTLPAPPTATVTTGGTFTSAIPYTTAAQADITFTASAGAAPVTLKLDMATLTQFGSATTMKILDQDGYAAGQLEAQVIDVNGIITGRYSNNQSRVLGQVAIANFNNPGGLTKSGESLFIQSANSGEAQIGASGTGGRGSLNPGSLEMSNVDLAQEFSNMIITQRGFQANSKIITTTDEMLQELANLKR
ncbi:MAG: flagellar hook protein FlgE [Anaerosporomusa subterranea]|jgi:flagellar hook protein FlgE|nr:flagellar hook protein FlgE [Anaerosporomusa subterranea]